MIIPAFLSPVVFGYAETHYQFKYFFSFLKKNEPEIIADIPHRLEPRSHLPVLLLVKDAHVYPVRVRQIEIIVKKDSEGIIRQKVPNSEVIEIDSPFWWNCYSVPLPKGVNGWLDVDVLIEFEVRGKILRCINDNLRTSTKRSFRIYRSADPLPAFDGWIQGDVHTHSNYSNDQVEFGPPLEASRTLCQAMGLGFFAATDHSYDLDDRLDNYLVNDPERPKWSLQQQEIDTLNRHSDRFVILRGEEVSCFNAQRRNVHLLLFGTRSYFPGSGDSAERWFHTDAEHTIEEILDRIDHETAAYAGHPTERAPLFQKLLIRRGHWGLIDMSHDKLKGLQILNGENNPSFQAGLAAWISLLLEGKKLFISAGNDAHGNFNRFRQIGIPFLTIVEKEAQVFGKMRSAILARETSEESVLKALHVGHIVITNGPVIEMDVVDNQGSVAAIGESICGRALTLRIKAKSTAEYGKFSALGVILGIIGEKAERILTTKRDLDNFSISYKIDLDLQLFRRSSYVRAEVHTLGGAHDDGKGFCYTNPIWVQTMSAKESSGEP